MSRLMAALRHETRMQARYGFMLAGLFMAVVWVIVVRLAPVWSLPLVTPLIIFIDMTTIGYYLMAALVLYDRGEATLLALLVSPLRFREYLSARLVVLAVLALVLAAPVALAGAGEIGLPRPGPLALGVVLTTLLTGLLGFIVVAPFRSISAFLVPSGLPLVVLALPLIDQLGAWQSPLFHLLPTHGGLLLLRAGFAPIDVWQIGLGLVSQAVWLVALASAARWAFARFIAARQGGA